MPNLEKDKSKIAMVVEAIIKDSSDKILLLKRSDSNNFFKGLWQLPGGKVEFGENIETAINREIKEETDLCCINSSLSKVHSFYQEFNGFKGTLFLMVYKCSFDGEIKLSKDHTEFGFFSIDEIKNLDLTDISKKSIFG